MSTEQPTLDDFTSEQTTEKPQGARYGLPTLEADYETEPDQRVCLECGSDISAEVARIIGDNNGCVLGCSDCTTGPVGQEYESDAVAARHALNRESGI